MKLVITEKPSVAQSIAAVIGAKQRGDGYLEGGVYLVSWCLGHLAELASRSDNVPACLDHTYVIVYFISICITNYLYIFCQCLSAQGYVTDAFENKSSG